tara:strand:+ start:279 stop:806 length:528 start_codon:yes stop_codon:yes gene_type:complete
MSTTSGLNEALNIGGKFEMAETIGKLAVGVVVCSVTFYILYFKYRYNWTVTQYELKSISKGLQTPSTTCTNNTGYHRRTRCTTTYTIPWTYELAGLASSGGQFVSKPLDHKFVKSLPVGVPPPSIGSMVNVYFDPLNKEKTETIQGGYRVLVLSTIGLIGIANAGILAFILAKRE